ncbi:MAG: D-alanyl-D-alanine carboxypeptidase family protein [Acidimicrobiia bacterium]|nr:D-alanyl-D-alanine carboxypeptidase family protein [Acidimicrobiia bacterium]
MITADDPVGADSFSPRRARAAGQWPWRRLMGRKLVLAVLSWLLVAMMPWPSEAQDSTTSSTGSTTTAAPTTTPSSAAPTTATPSSAVVTSQLEATTTSGQSAEEKAKLDAAAAAKAKEIDAANARLGDLSDALGVLNKRVKDQSARVDYANSQVADAEAKVQQNEVAVAEAEQSLNDLEARLEGQAIRNFMGQGGDAAAVLVTGDPNTSIRMQTMLAEVTQSDIDFSDTLQAAKEDLEVQRAEAQNAVEEARALRADADNQLAILRGDRQAQANLASSAENRLDHLLAERANLGALGADVDTGDEAKLVNTLKSSSAALPPPGSSVEIPATVSASEIKLAGNGIRVHESIVAQVQALLTDAAAAGFNLGGGGYRDPAAQIATRRSNCGTSTYALYQMPASQCSPPTARPGQSMHERGLAIDFTSGGQLIRSRSSSAFIWLSNNAPRYGLYNLPSEPWHWSINGN